VDAEIGEFWIGNPWGFHGQRKNLSAYERNRLFLNEGDLQFRDASYLSGTDSEGDGRASVAADLNRDGMSDLFVRQAGGGALLVFENHMPRKHYLDIRLRGTVSNRSAIGARIVAQVGGRTLVREFYPANSFMSQSPREAHVGLGDATQVDSLTVTWPSGSASVFRNIPADRLAVVVEGSSKLQYWDLPAADSASRP
jgi:hypothetical protein